MPIAGRPMVVHVLERAARIGPPVTLATSSEPEDDDLAATAERAGFPVSRGSRDDVLDRFARAVPPDATAIVRVTADCPLFDPNVGRAILAALQASEVDLVCNTITPTFPDGLDCCAVTHSALARAAREATLPSDREHVMPYIWRQPGIFRLINLAHSPDLSAERWTVDDARDLDFVRAIHERLRGTSGEDPMSMYAVLRILDREPELRAMNAGTTRDEGYARSLMRDPSPNQRSPSN